jgi:hypothetical protein
MAPNRHTRKKRCDENPHLTALKVLFNGPKFRYGEASFSEEHGAKLDLSLTTFYTRQPRDSRLEVHDPEEVNALVREGTKAAGPILEYVKSSSALRCMAIGVDSEDKGWDEVNIKLADLFYKAIADAQTLEELNIWSWDVMDQPRAAFLNLLASTHSLKILGLCGYRFRSNQAQWLGDALRSATGIERVVLEGAYAPIVQALISLPNLCELVLPMPCFYRRSESSLGVEALKELLSNTKALDLLDLGEIHLAQEQMQTLVVGLQANQTVTRLLFHPSTEFPSGDTTFSNYLQSTVAQPHGLRELSYGGNIDSLAEAMVRSQNLSTFTVASALQELWLSTPEPTYGHGNSSSPNVAKFLESYSSNAAEIHLISLNLQLLDDTSCKALIRCVPTLVHLRELNIESVSLATKRMIPKLIESIKKNGCLHRVSLPKSHFDLSSSGRPVLTQREMLRLKSFCQRNDETMQRFVSEWFRDSINDGSRNIWLFPSLFVAACMAPRTAPSVLLLGLYPLPIGVIGCNDKKRSCR